MSVRAVAKAPRGIAKSSTRRGGDRVAAVDRLIEARLREEAASGALQNRSHTFHAMPDGLISPTFAHT